MPGKIEGFGFGTNTGNVTLAVQDPAGFQPETLSIQRDDAWEVIVSWDVPNLFWMADPHYQWVITLYLESLGHAFEGMPVKPETKLTNSEPVVLGRRSYEKRIPIPAANDPLMPPDFVAGTYKLTAVITAEEMFTATPQPIPYAGFVEGPVLQLYDPA